MKAQACIFDFDGVVVDSEKYHHLAWRQVAQDMGTDFSYEEYMPYKSAGRKMLIPYLLKKAGIPYSDAVYQKYYDMREQTIMQALAALSPKDVTPGLTDFLALLRRSGIKTAVASSSAAAHVTAKRFGLFDKFDAFVDGESNLPNKPNPHLFLRAAQLLQTEPCSCVVFEDSINGLKAAKAAGMHSVGIQTYFTDMADKIIDDFTDADLTLLQFDK